MLFFTENLDLKGGFVVDLVRFTIHPNNEAELKALMDEINAHSILTETEKQQLLEELNDLQYEVEQP